MSSRPNRPRAVALATAFLQILGGSLLMAQAARPAASATRPAQPTTPTAGPPATRPAAATKPGAEPLPSMDDLRVMLEQAKYPDLLKQLPRVLVLKGKAAEPYNRYELLMIKFETHMRMKAQASAVGTLRDAAEVTDDPKRVAYSKAVDLLIKRSKSFQYQPGGSKKEKPAPIDIIDPESRKAALKALLADEMAQAAPKVEKALDGQSLGDIAGAVQQLQGLDVLESAAEGGEETQRMVSDLRSRGAALLAKAVQRMQGRHDDIHKLANEMVRYVVTTPSGNGGTQQQVRYRKRGLINHDYRDLKEIVALCDKVIPNARGLAQATGGKIKEVEDLITAAEDLRRKADRTMTTNYNEN